ncbi:MAG: AAA family ATPase [Kiritimatiellae bacterium]|nr:AAA family ATPase [Kiritimatiellia bacterium]
MKRSPKARRLTAAEVDWQPPSCQPRFRTTEELEPLDKILGQDRGLRALELGLGISHPTYNIYVAGLSGTGKKDTIRRLLTERVAKGKPPSDWIYIHNFDDPDRPIAVDLEAGQGVELQRAMESFVATLRDELPKAFAQEDFSREKRRISRVYEQRNQEVFAELEQKAREKGLTVQPLPTGQIIMVPLKANGQPMTPEEFEQLPDREKETIGARQREMAELMDSFLNRGRELRRQLTADVKEVERNFAARIITPLLEKILARFPHPKLKVWGEKLRLHMLDHLEDFQQPEPAPAEPMELLAGKLQPPPPFTEYKVNVVVDNSKLDRPPVIIEEAPSYKNLFGSIGGYVDRFGRIIGDFTHIRAGSLLRANGGYLVLNLLEALMEPFVWKELKRSIKSGSVEFHAYDPLGLFTSLAIRPEPIPLKVKLVVIGNPLLYHLLHLYDEDFPDVFRVKADFAVEMDMTKDSIETLGRFVRKLQQSEEILPFDRSGVVELTRTSARLAANKGKLTAEFSRLASVVREASFWARNAGATVVTADHVRQAARERVYRCNMIEEKIRELIREGTLLINVDGTAIGQVNGLAVVNLGDYSFGRPSRVTASVGIGAAGVINVERESKLSGETYDKAMLILEGYLRNTYAREHPITLSAGITMEQSYGMVDGDSASVAEILCLLSAIARIPLRQDVAITGSVNQWGEVQAVGGVNEKIEGFFDVCRELGLTGRQGVCIPAANQRHLILRPDIVEAVRKRRFHIWAVETVDQAIHLVSGIPAGNIGTRNSFHWRVDQRLQEMVTALREQRAPVSERGSVVIPSPRPAQRDPRPPLPGKEGSED